MNIKYLKETLIPQREREIENGDNLATRNPIYVVYSLRDQYMSGHSDYSPITNLKGMDPEPGYLFKRPDWGEPQFCLNEDGSDLELDGDEMEDDGNDLPYTDDENEAIEITRIWVDDLQAIFLTSKAAYDYMEYQRHNLPNAYVYVHSGGYRNQEMDMLFSTPVPLWTKIKNWFTKKAKR